MWTGRLEVMLTGLEGCMCGDGTPPVRGSPPPRSDILEADDGLSDGAGQIQPGSSACVLFSTSSAAACFLLCGENALKDQTAPGHNTIGEPSRVLLLAARQWTHHGHRWGFIPEDRRQSPSSVPLAPRLGALLAAYRGRKRKFLSPESHSERRLLGLTT